jgi:hypothetical protein
LKPGQQEVKRTGGKGDMTSREHEVWKVRRSVDQDVRSTKDLGTVGPEDRRTGSLEVRRSIDQR